MNLTQPPYPFHPIATSLHHAVFYSVISIIFPSDTAITLSVLIVQFLASLFVLYLFYHLLIENFHLDIRRSLTLVYIYDLIFISPFLILAISEILFLFYQLLAWTLFFRRRYFFAALATAMTFAVRFTGAFFVVGMLLAFLLEWWGVKDTSLRLLIHIILASFLMFVIGFSSFLLSLFAFNDFWLPITSQSEIYQESQGYATSGMFSFPFLWWLTYFQWVFLSNSPFEFVYLILAVITLGLGFLSLYALLKRSYENNSKNYRSMTLIFLFGFLGVNFIVSGSNFPRFLCYVFPMFPIFPLWLQSHNISSFNSFILIIGAGTWGILFNILWWMTYPI
ncbi:MAG: hypothetical protein ACFFDT_01580 [Candidatus Hodarchaeota archaeon]